MPPRSGPGGFRESHVGGSGRTGRTDEWIESVMRLSKTGSTWGATWHRAEATPRACQGKGRRHGFTR